MPAIGNLRHFITIQKPTSVASDYTDAAIKTWTTFANCWAEIKGRGKDEESSDATITIRYVAGVETDMRIVSGDDTYNIASVADPDGRRQWLEIGGRNEQ